MKSSLERRFSADVCADALRRATFAVWLAGFAFGLGGCASGGAFPGAGSSASTASSQAWPRIIAHRGGTGDAPENTLEAIRLALAHHADALWLTVQLSHDGVPVLYRPADLNALTDASGPVASYDATQLARVNAGWTFTRGDAFPYRAHPVGVPTLAQALQAIPATVPVILDMKALPAAPQAQAVAHVLDTMQAWNRVSIYSTEAAYQDAFAAYPQARLFESRDATRTRLERVLLGEGCIDPPAPGVRVAFEMHRDLTVSEQFTLGEGRSTVHGTLWSPATVACFRQRGDVQIVAIAVNNAADYRRAACLGVNAVLADSPEKMQGIRAGARSVTCEPGAASVSP